MASVPSIEEQVTDDLVILNLEKVGLSDEQFVELCSDNRELHLELTAQKELVIMTLPGGKTGLRNGEILLPPCRLGEKEHDGNHIYAFDPVSSTERRQTGSGRFLGQAKPLGCSH